MFMEKERKALDAPCGTDMESEKENVVGISSVPNQPQYFKGQRRNLHFHDFFVHVGFFRAVSKVRQKMLPFSWYMREERCTVSNVSFHNFSVEIINLDISVDGK